MRLRSHRLRLALLFATPILLVIAYLFLRLGYRAMFAGSDPASKAVSAQIEAAKREDCARVFSLYSARTRQLMKQGGRLPRPNISKEETIKTYCNYAEEGDLPDYLPSKVRLLNRTDGEAIVAATYKYDRFFGSFGEGEREVEFVVVAESGIWKIDHSESLDPQSPTNLDEAAMSLLNQLFTAERYLMQSSNQFSKDSARIQEQLPGYRFPPIESGIAHSGSSVGHLFVELGSRRNLVCLSTKSGSGILVMIKVNQGKSASAPSYQYGKSIPTNCDSRTLARPYHGASSEIR